MPSSRYSDIQLDALREIANIGSGSASTALAAMLGRSVDLSVPSAAALPLAEAVSAIGPEEQEATGIVLPVVGDLDAMVLLLFGPDDAGTVCRLLGVEPDSELAESALGEIGNVLGTSYINALAQLTGLDLEPQPPHVANDFLGALVATVLAASAYDTDVALILDSELKVEDEECSLAFLMLPTAGGVDELLVRLGL